MPCFFDAYEREDYQVCSCGRHVWSVKGSRMLKANKAGMFKVAGGKYRKVVGAATYGPWRWIWFALLAVAIGAWIAFEKMNIKIYEFY